MKKTVILILIYLSCFSDYTESQTVCFSAGSGIGKFSMKDLKELNEDLKMNLPVRAVLVDDFPSYPYFSLACKIGLYNIGLALTYTHYSTGSRINYADYSGYIAIDQLIRSNAVGFPFDVGLGGKNQVRFFIEPGLVITGLKILDHTVLFSQVTDSDYEFQSKTFYTSLGFSYVLKVNRMVFKTDLGYFIDYGGKLFLVDNNKYYLEDVKQNPLHASLSGIRFNASVGYLIIR